MKETFKLQHPVLINGKEVHEFTYDFEEINGHLWEEAVRQSQRSQNFNVATFDYIFHKALAGAAVIAVNQSVAWEDFDRMKGIDIQRFANLGAVFMSSSMEDFEQETSAEPTDNSAEPTTPPSETSKK